MKVIGYTNIKEFEITDFEQYGLFALSGYESNLKSSLKDMLENHSKPDEKEIVQVMYATYLYGDKYSPLYKEYMPIVMVQKNIGKWGISQFEAKGFENANQAMIKASFNQGTNFPTEIEISNDSHKNNQKSNIIIEEPVDVLTIYLSLIMDDSNMLQLEMKLDEFKNKNCYNSILKSYQAYQLEKQLNKKDNVVPKIKL